MTTSSAAPAPDNLTPRLSVLYLEADDAGSRHWYALVGLGGRAPSFGSSGTLPGVGDQVVGTRVWVKDDLIASGRTWADFARHNPDLARYRPIGSRAVSPKSGAIAASGSLPGFLDAGCPEGQANLRRITELGRRLALVADAQARTSENGIDDLAIPSGPVPAPVRSTTTASGRSAKSARSAGGTGEAPERLNAAEVLTQRTLEMLRDGIVPWQRGWRTAGGPARNITGHVYRGINAILLPAAGYGSPYWMTRHQAEERGGAIKASETKRAFPALWWRFRKVETTDEKTGEIRVTDRPLAGMVTVYNLEQTENVPLPADEAATRSEFTPIASAEAFVAALRDGPSIAYDGGTRAFYRPDNDTIHLPMRERFSSSDELYAALFHELVHSTGHATRVGRPGIGSFDHFGSDQYSREELVAEFGAALVAGRLGIDRSFENSASYIANWMTRIASDPRALIAAGSAAQHAADWILAHAEPLGKEPPAA